MDGQPENIMHLVPYIGWGRHNEVSLVVSQACGLTYSMTAGVKFVGGH